MSEIFLDTETTGLLANDGDRIVEIACVETKDLIPTGKVFHKHINPKRDVPEDAFKVHGFFCGRWFATRSFAKGAQAQGGSASRSF